MTEGVIRLMEPATATDGDLDAFARLVREGFPKAQDLEARVGRAKWIAMSYSGHQKPVAVGALKQPDEDVRVAKFAAAGAPTLALDVRLDLGWIFVEPAVRRRGIARDICRGLLDCVPTDAVFATTRIDNVAMRRILELLGFTETGTAFAWRHETLTLLLREPRDRA